MESPSAPESPQSIKNPKLIKSVEKQRNRAKRKCHTSLQGEIGLKVGENGQTLGISCFGQKFEFFKDYSNTVFISFSATSGKNLCKIGQFLGEIGPTHPQSPPPLPKKNGTFHRCCIATKAIEILQLGSHKCYTNETYHDYVCL